MEPRGVTLPMVKIAEMEIQPPIKSHCKGSFWSDRLHSFRVVSRAEDDQSTQRLLQFTYILKASLPSMQINDVYTPVFSGNNENLLMFYKGKLIGGATFTCEHEDFAQIKLLAIAPAYRSKGKGSYLMNVLKSLLQQRKIPLIVVNADNNSKGFYQKHNFTTEEFVSNSNWQQEHYYFSTKMQCLVNPTIDYILLKKNLRRQREVINELVSQLYVDNNNYSYSLIPSKARHTRDEQGRMEYFCINPSDLEGLVTNGWTWEQYKQQLKTKQTQTYRMFVTSFTTLFQKAAPQVKFIPKNLASSSFFAKKRPVDLLSLAQKVDVGGYEGKEQFWEEVEGGLRETRRWYRGDPVVRSNLRQLEALAREMRERVI